MNKKTSALSVTAGLLVTLMSIAVCGVSVYILIVSSDVRLAIGESVSRVNQWGNSVKALFQQLISDKRLT